MTPTRREFGALAAAIAAAIPSTLFTSTAAAAEATTEEIPWGGPLAPDKPLAKAYNDGARALAEADDNPVIRWQYRVWCQTGYRSPSNTGTGQPVDQLTDPATDFVSPKGFLYRDHVRPMPAGGVQFLDNAWYFGTDFTGLVIVRTPDGLIMLDALTTPQDMRTQFLDQAGCRGPGPQRHPVRLPRPPPRRPRRRREPDQGRTRATSQVRHGTARRRDHRS